MTIDFLAFILSFVGIALFVYKGFKVTETDSYYYSDEYITIPTLVTEDD